MPKPIEYVRVTDDVVPARAYSLPKRAFDPQLHTLLEDVPAVDVYGRPLPQEPFTAPADPPKAATAPAATSPTVSDATKVPAPVEPNPKSGQKAEPTKES